MSGFIPIRRSLFKHFLFKENRVFSRFEAWLDLIQMASFTDENTEIISGKIVSRGRGEIIASLRFLMKRWGWSMSKVSDFLELLRSQQMVVVDKESGISKIQLINFKKHNDLYEKNNKGDINGYSKTLTDASLHHIKETVKSTQTDTARRQQGDTGETNIKKFNKENNDNEEPEIIFSPIEECLTISMNDERWIRANKTSEAELLEFNNLLEGRGIYQKNPAEYKSHFHNWKRLGKKDEENKNSGPQKSVVI